MAKDVKVEIIYYKSSNDVTLEFGLHGNFPCRLLSHTCQDLESFFRAFKRAIQRSEIIITAGGLSYDEYLPAFIAKTIGKKVYIPNYQKEGIKPERPYPLPEGAIPLGCKNGYFGGYLIECGPQAIFGLCDDRKCRQEIAEKVIRSYINEYCAVYSADGAIVSSALSEEMKLNDNEPCETPSETADYTAIEEIPMTAVEAEPTRQNDLPDVILPQEPDAYVDEENIPCLLEDAVKPEEAEEKPKISGETRVILSPDDLEFEITKDKINPRFRYTRILCIIFVLLIIFSVIALIYFFRSDGNGVITANNSAESGISDTSSAFYSQHVDIVIGQNDSGFEFSNKENASADEFEQTIDENESQTPIEIIITSKASSSTVSSQKSSSVVSSKVNSSSFVATSAEPSTTAESTTPSESSTSSASTAASESEEIKTSSIISSSSSPSSSDTSSTSSLIKTSNALYLWDVTLTVTNNGNVISGSAVDIVARSVEAELGDRYPDEALKAQAITCYCWLLYHGAASGKAPSIPLTTASQKSIDAVNAVKGQLCVYDGTVAETVYGAYSAGYTAAYQNIWQWKSNWQATTKVPYLQSVECKVDETLANFKTTTTYTADEVKKKISEKYGIDVSSMDKNKWIVPTMYDENNLYCIRVSIGGKDCAGPELRNTLFGLYNRTSNPNGLKSSAYTVTYDSKTDTFTVVCKGWGHGVGMSQEAAAIYAKQGWDYEKIVKHFYLGIDILKFTKE